MTHMAVNKVCSILVEAGDRARRMKRCFILLLFSAAHSLQRMLMIEHTPGCKNCTHPFYYVEAAGPNDTLHYMWDFTTKPTIFIALTQSGVKPIFKWDDFANNKKSISFESPPDYTFALILNKIIQFNDIDDSGILTPSSENFSFDTRNFSWKLVSNQTENEDFRGLIFKGTNYSHGLLNGTVLIELTAFANDGHDFLQPRLIHTGNSTQCRIALERLHSDLKYNASRYAVELILFSSDDINSSSKTVSRMNLDDENSPGVFSVVDLMTPKSQDHLYKGVFLQWRPVAFLNEMPSLVNSTEVLTYNVTKVDISEDEIKDTLIYKYYGSSFSLNLIQKTVVSIGFAEDGFYKKTNYSSWTFTINYGSPETEKFSILVIMVMAIGLGFPVVLILLGGSYMLARRLRAKNETSLAR